MPSRSIFFFNRRSAFSTDSPFLSLISVNADSLPLRHLIQRLTSIDRFGLQVRGIEGSFGHPTCQSANSRGVVWRGSRAHCHCITGPRLFRSEEHTSELQSRSDLVCRLLLEKKKKQTLRLVVLHKSSYESFSAG